MLLTFPALAFWWAQQNPAERSLLEYGALGVVALLLAGVVRYLFARQEKLHEQALARTDGAHERAMAQVEKAHAEAIAQAKSLLDQATARADRAEESLDRLNELVRDRLIAEMTRTAEAVSRATEVIADSRRDDRRGIR